MVWLNIFRNADFFHLGDSVNICLDKTTDRCKVIVRNTRWCFSNDKVVVLPHFYVAHRRTLGVLMCLNAQCDFINHVNMYNKAGGGVGGGGIWYNTT